MPSRHLCCVLAILSSASWLASCSDSEPAATKPAVTDTATATDTTDAGGTDAAASDDSVSTDAANADTWSADPLQWPLAEPGPFVCGHRIVQVKYQMPAGLGEREIPVNIWYPASEAKGEHPVYGELFTDKQAYRDAPLAKPAFSFGYPVIVNSHGLQGFAGNSAFLWCHAASHGWVALVPEHLGTGLFDTPDVLPLESFLHRATDVKATLDWAGTLQADPLPGNWLEPWRSAVTSHSFGGVGVWSIAGAKADVAELAQRCANKEFPDCGKPGLLEAFATDLSDKRPLTFIVTAGSGNNSGVLDPDTRNLATKPVLQMNGTYDDGGQAQLYADVTAVDLTWMNVQDGCHQLYGVGNTYLGPAGCKALPDEEGFAIVRPLVLAWLRYHVLDDRSPAVTGIVDGTALPSPKVDYKHKTPQK